MQEFNTSSRTLSPLSIALILLVLVVLWIASGFVFPSEDVQEVQKTERTLFNVRVVESEAKPVMREVINYGVSEAERDVEMFAQTSSMVQEWHVKEGAFVEKGTLILTMKLEDRNARLKEARSEVTQRQIDYNAAKKLAKDGFISRTQQAQRRTQLDAAKAALNVAELEMDRTKIIAPFDGVVERIFVEPGELVDDSRTPVVRMVDHHPLVVRVDLSEFNRADVKVGQQAHVTMADGRDVLAKIRYVGTVGDSDIRTFRVEMEIENEPEERADLIPSGMSVTVRIPVEEVVAHRISTSALLLDDKHQLGVKTVDGEGRVIFHPIELVKSSMEGTWIKGKRAALPEKMTLITLGGAFVGVGEEVRVSLTNETLDETAPQVEQP